MKTAKIDVAVELFESPFFGQMVDALNAHGLKIISSEDGLPGFWVRLVIEERPGFDVLPKECADGPCAVRPIFVQEAHGNQRIVRVQEFWVVK